MGRFNCPIVLHDHLDGSRTLLPILPTLYKISGKQLPFGTGIEINEGFKKLFANPQIDLVKKFSYTTGVMQSKETLFLAALNYVLVRAQQGFKYCEATIAPQYHTLGGLSVPEVINTLIEGIKEGEVECPEIEVNLIPSVGREVSPAEAVRLVELFAECDRNYCPGVGLVCDEAAHPPEKHSPMFKTARKLGFKTTCHAGEWVNIPPTRPDLNKDLPQILRNIRTAIFDLKVDRIGHAIGLIYSPELISTVVRRHIGIEGCPGSNLFSGLILDVRQLGIKDLLNYGVLYSLNPDDDLFMPDLEETFELCESAYQLTHNHKERLIQNAWLTRFGNRKEHRF